MGSGASCGVRQPGAMQSTAPLLTGWVVVAWSYAEHHTAFPPVWTDPEHCKAVHGFFQVKAGPGALQHTSAGQVRHPRAIWCGALLSLVGQGGSTPKALGFSWLVLVPASPRWGPGRSGASPLPTGQGALPDAPPSAMGGGHKCMKAGAQGVFYGGGLPLLSPPQQ